MAITLLIGFGGLFVSGALIFACVIGLRSARAIWLKALFCVLVVPLALGFLVFSPILWVIPGTIGSTLFGSRLAVGMGRQDVDGLRRVTLGSDSGVLNSFADDKGDRSDTVAHVWYSFGGFPCFEYGRVYRLEFDTGQTLRRWSDGDWENGC